MQRPLRTVLAAAGAALGAWVMLSIADPAQAQAPAKGKDAVKAKGELKGKAGPGTPTAGELIGEPSGTGPLSATAESRRELPGHTIYRPLNPPAAPLPLYIWGNGGCGNNGLAHAAYLREIASHGYFVIALGVSGAAAANAPPPPANEDATQPAQMLQAIEWATRETGTQGGNFFRWIDASRIAVGGHSCGGLQAISISDDPRIDTTLVLNSGVYIDPSGGRSRVKVEKTKLAQLHGPMLYLTGGPSDIAHRNAADDVEKINHVPVFFGSLPVGHGGTFAQPNGGDWARVSTRWLDWQLKQDADASWDFAGQCRLCTDSRWTVVRKQMPLPTGPFRESVYVPVRDGTRLAMNLYRPAKNGIPVEGPQPVIFSFTPYRARYRDATGRIVAGNQISREADAALLADGYVLAVADVRGKGASFGARRGFQDRTEALDGYDLVQWLASRSWSSGNVGMYGCSYLGGSAFQVATTAPPALKAIFAGASDLDKFSFVRNGGVPAQFNTRPDEPLSDDLMSVPLDEDRDGSLLRAAVSQHANNTPMAPLWYGMPFRDSESSLTRSRFWEEVGPYTYLDVVKRSGIATYFWSNWRDEPTSQMIMAAENLNGRLLLGPGSHCAQPPDFDFAGEVKSFFDEHLRGIRPAQPQPRVTWWLDGAEQPWRRAAEWPGVSAARETWYLAGGNRLQAGAPAPGRAEFDVNYNVGANEYFAFWVDSQHGRGVSFTSGAMDTDQELVGFPTVRLTVSSDRPEPILFAYLEDLAPDNSVDVVAFGRLGAAYRKTGQAPYNTLGLPWPTGLAADYAPLQPNREVQLTFALTPVSEVIPAGHRLRLVVTGADPRQRNLDDIRTDPPPHIVLALGGEGGGRIEVPLKPRSK